MGTDIHWVWQKKTPTGWETIEPAYEDDRNYRLFAWLADVRNIGIVPISKPKGLPVDFEIGDTDLGDHSFSWLSSREILAVGPPKYVITSWGREEIYLEEFVASVKGTEDRVGEFRIVFGFDS